MGASPVERRAASMLGEHGVEVQPGRSTMRDAMATALMDLYRRTSASDVFETLVALSTDQLRRRVLARTRYLGDRVDVEELVQDAFVNIYRYPDRFDASRPGAFRAWSSTIVDNAVRRHLRRANSGPDVRLKPAEILAQEPDQRQREPGQTAIDSEDCRIAADAYRLFLGLYLNAYHALSERERFVLQMVEVRGMRYAEVAKAIGIRPEALKMVVFRARRRIHARISAVLPSEEQPVAEAVREPALLAG